MPEITVAITAASYHGNKGAAAMLQSSIKQLLAKYGAGLSVNLMSTYPRADRQLAPFDFIKVVSAKPERVMLIAFPCALLYWLFKWCPPLLFLLKKNKIIRAYADTDLVLDLAGVSFVDSRGFVMNTYAAITVSIPLLLGVPVVKYSQALGSFKSFYNRWLAKLILPKMALICARGQVTKKQLAEIGITKNVKLCADGAFSMPDDEIISQEVEKLIEADSFYRHKFITLSLSSVVNAKCMSLGIDYRRCMVEFIEYLTSHHYGVLLIANAARLDSDKTRNNDLPICKAVYDAVADKKMLHWYHEEMAPEKIRALIGRSEILVGSRFHAMIAALEQKTPVLLVGWSHKYKEVLDMFGLGSWAVDYAQLSPAMLIEKFEEVSAARLTIKKKITQSLPQVRASSLQNIQYFSEVAQDRVFSQRKKGRALDFNHPEIYAGDYLACRMAYATDEKIRANAASGGVITALLCSLLRRGEIDGAWVTRSLVKNGQLTYKTFIATSVKEIMDCSGSIYMDIPQIKHLDVLTNFPGKKIAVVMLPCQLRMLNAFLKTQPQLNRKIKFKIALYCSGTGDERSMIFSLKKKGIPLTEIKKVIFRRGHYRGKTVVQKIDGTEQEISYTKTICAYKNAYFFTKESCMICQDYFGREADLSCGDIWLKSMKKNPIKHTSCIIRSEQGKRFYQSAIENGDLVDFYFNGKMLLRSQKRGLNFKYPSRFSHRLAKKLARYNQKISLEKPELVEKIPLPLLYYYMYFIRLLLNF